MHASHAINVVNKMLFIFDPKETAVKEECARRDVDAATILAERIYHEFAVNRKVVSPTPELTTTAIALACGRWLNKDERPSLEREAEADGKAKSVGHYMAWKIVQAAHAKGLPVIL